jgi:predicted dehydrogenase
LSDQPIRVGVVGAGFWATEMHLPAFQKLSGVRVVGVCAGTKAGAARAADRFSIPFATDDYRELIDRDDVDVIDIVAPNNLHAPVAVAAAAAGKHIICIKPLALNLAEADKMIQAAVAAGVRLFYAENVPFIPAVQRMHSIVEAGGIGDLFRIKACEGIPGPHSDWFLDPARSGGGVLIDMAVHSVAFCRFFAGSAVETVYAESGTFVHGARTTAEDTAVLTLRFANGAIGQCEDSWSLAGAMDSRFELFGTRGRILVDNLHRQPLQVVSETGYTDGGSESVSGGWSFPLPISADLADGHVAMLDHFITCLRTGEESLSEAAFGREVLAVIEAAATSAWTGSRQSLSLATEVAR